MSPLAEKLKKRIAESGPLSIADYMEACLGDPDHGYYRTRDPLGARGDFTTAPEISQVFGELIGLWCVEVWRGMGAPAPFRLIELGPGRGTLMSDALRASRIVPGFAAAARLHLVETGPVLRQAQGERLGEHDPSWHDTISDVPSGPALLIANEFLDALPIRQFQRQGDGWQERLITIDGDGFTFCLSPSLDAPPEGLPLIADTARDGDVVESSEAVRQVIAELAVRAEENVTTALFIDYGHARSAIGDTFQAVAAHGFADPLQAPGAADLTAHVDFEALAGTARAHGLQAFGPLEQGRFLLALGLAQRCERLMNDAESDKADEIESGARRLVDPGQMGSLFKVMALTGPDAPAPPAFETGTR